MPVAKTSVPRRPGASLRPRLAFRLAITTLCLVTLPGPSQGQAGPAKATGKDPSAAAPARKDNPAPEFWFKRDRAAAGAAAEVVGSAHPLTALLLCHEGKSLVVWGLEVEAVPDFAPRIDPILLSGIRDRTPLPGLNKMPLKEWEDWELADYELYCAAVRLADRTPPAAFARSAAENKHVNWGTLFREPQRFRGEVIPVKGLLKRVRQEEAPPALRREGIKHVYEGWVFTETYGSNPVCVIFPQLPEGLGVAETMSRQVQFDGYFLKRYRYLSGRGARETLLFVAPTLKLQPGQGGGEARSFIAFSGTVVGIIVALFVATVSLMFGLSWWFRRNDRVVRERLAATRSAMFVDPSEVPAPEGQLTGARPGLFQDEREPPPGPPSGNGH